MNNDQQQYTMNTLKQQQQQQYNDNTSRQSSTSTSTTSTSTSTNHNRMNGVSTTQNRTTSTTSTSVLSDLLFKMLSLVVKQSDNESFSDYRKRLAESTNSISRQQQQQQHAAGLKTDGSNVDDLPMYDKLQQALKKTGDKEKLIKFGDLYRDLLSTSKNNQVILETMLRIVTNGGVMDDRHKAKSASLEEQIQSKLQQTKISQQQTMHQPPPLHNNFLKMQLTTSPLSPKPAAKQPQQHQQQQQQNRQPLVDVAEELLVRDLIYVFQGIDGKYIKFFNDIDSFAVEPNVNLSRPRRDMIGRLAEFGWLFRQIRIFLVNGEFRHKGLVNQCFCSALQDELAELYRLIAILETKIDRNVTDNPALQSYKPPPDYQSENTSLMGVFVWIQEPMARLRSLAALVAGVANRKGGATISYVESFSAQGNSVVHSMVKSILVRISQPIITMITRWIFEGEINDPFGEFFILKNQKIQLERVWKEKYTLQADMLPTFIDQDMSRRILLIGKSINFMKQCCKETHWSVDRFTLGPGVQLETYADLGNLEAVINRTSEHSSKRLFNLMMDKFRYMEHCQALRRYMLLGQGDFIQGLMDMIGEDLLKPAAQLTRHRLVGIMESVIRTSNAQYEDEDILKRLDISLLDERPGSTGWDIFSIDYHIDMPITTIISKQDMVRYKKIFHFLWTVKKVEFSLSSIWRKTRASYNTLVLMSKYSKSFGTDFQRSNMLSHEMTHFITNFNYYVMFEAIENSWVKMQQAVGAASDLDQLIDAHSQYLQDICTKTFLSNSESCYDVFKRILVVINKFTMLQKNLCSLADAVRKEVKISETQESRIGRELTNYVTHLSVLYRDYRTVFNQFEQEMANLKLQKDVNPISMSYMLDFNEYYSSTRAAAASSSNNTSSSSSSSGSSTSPGNTSK
ncbi:hypothetical protein SAMD00019534_072080 [Acytostelium subglobosum LB1]|uniref:hypothetical protein n=1 Tax=Acytostelium subglobosum LB1 TaxID=1410327 RepID=UPI000644EA55|nr:hypothetical protein SAMD00019534_072080 [Acytostelium subglobosum LB1]GAM24033.1 hypothetical protein SAMD00019534_072080 [Acytostelium subglobosum LB1]|eukprot:XP_012753069.1 hypothetical protein SAMD00019534_072080 [Acytostelium subglobosum LB1]